MRRSLTEYVTALGRWWLLLILDLFFGALGAYLDVTRDGPIPLWLWLSALLAGLAFAPFIAFNKVRAEREQAREELCELQESRPSIEVEVINDARGKMLLEVTNLGEHGDFEAQIEMVEGREFMHGVDMPTVPVYTGCWELSLRPKASLPQGHSDRLMVGKLEIQAALWAAEFHMYFYDMRAGCPKHFGTTSWRLVGEGTVAARFLLRMAISCTPRMGEGPFVRTYVVDGRAQPHFQEAIVEGGTT